jgi:hypothetical protein
MAEEQVNPTAENTPKEEAQLMKPEDAVKLINDMIREYPNYLFFACDQKTGGMAVNGDSRRVGMFILSTMKSNKAVGESLSATFSAILKDYTAHKNKTDKNVN